MSTIETRHGHVINLLDIKPENIQIEDIAFSLSNLCRFNGHSARYYSVAEHSVLVSSRVLPEYRLQALLHDAAEAYLGDIPGPVKHMFPDLCEFEKNLESIIFKKFNVDVDETSTEKIKEADNAQFITEISVLLPSGGKWLQEFDPELINNERIPYCLTPNSAFKLFMDTFRMVAGQETITKIYIED